jgi:hypothetical protein
MRAATVVFLAGAIVAAVVGFQVEHRDPGAATPLTLTLVAAAAALWLGFTANRDARTRLAAIRRAFTVHGEPRRLLRDHLQVYLVILLRLACIVALGIVVAVWGTGPGTAAGLQALAAVLMLLTWPTEHKSRLLLRRATAERDEVTGATSRR